MMMRREVYLSLYYSVCIDTIREIIFIHFAVTRNTYICIRIPLDGLQTYENYVPKHLLCFDLADRQLDKKIV